MYCSSISTRLDHILQTRKARLAEFQSQFFFRKFQHSLITRNPQQGTRNVLNRWSCPILPFRCCIFTFGVTAWWEISQTLNRFSLAFIAFTASYIHCLVTAQVWPWPGIAMVQAVYRSQRENPRFSGGESYPLCRLSSKSFSRSGET